MKDTLGRLILTIVLLVVNILLWDYILDDSSSTRKYSYSITPARQESSSGSSYGSWSTDRTKSSTSKAAPVTSVPYVGMYVPSQPSNWTWQGTDNLTVKDSSGKAVRTVKYRYDVTPKIYVVWVSESSDQVVKVSITDPTSKAGTNGSSKSKSSSSSLDTSGYYHPDDFYYDNYDDFYDYEEAEDYYYSHGGK